MEKETITKIVGDILYTYELKSSEFLSKEQLSERYGKLSDNVANIKGFLAEQMTQFFDARGYFASLEDSYKQDLRDFIGENIEKFDLVVQDDKTTLKQMADGIDINSEALLDVTANLYWIPKREVTDELLLKTAIMLRIDSFIFGSNERA
jgi:hypothetical protein